MGVGEEGETEGRCSATELGIRQGVGFGREKRNMKICLPKYYKGLSAMN